MPAVKEPCKQEACNIQACLSKNAFNSERCLQAILKLQKCCDNCENKSTHCASVKPLLEQIAKKAELSHKPKV
ncbi:hypothetical protein M758_11G123100 [Ceratodon purpureus]|uniref:Cx9C motif-containing protein 4 n=1 Tax=Ceratodon purpureus TaxID=3225 RepID=A0A8T0GEG4_CERPU|nr:hypothetical protein KC19_11G128000 [Ceratodon purpureus]KAG0601577.1 hypothetical protein M758_11G123100 [Ceratodon purpureus]